jgi:hypothetical protein
VNASPLLNCTEANPIQTQAVNFATVECIHHPPDQIIYYFPLLYNQIEVQKFHGNQKLVIYGICAHFNVTQHINARFSLIATERWPATFALITSN